MSENQIDTIPEYRADEVVRFLAKDRPPTLFHYATVEGALGILETKRIFASHVASLNDLTEVGYSQPIIEAELHCLKERGYGDVGMLVRRMVAALGYEFFIACFSEDDDILPMWQAYASGGSGYALGFPTSLVALIGGGQLVPVRYGPEDCASAARAIVGWFMNMITAEQLAAYEKRKEKDAQTAGLITAFAIGISLLSHASKDVSVKHEREWRLLLPVSTKDTEDSSTIKFRPRNGLMVPYVACELPRDAKDRLPLAGVRFGPTLNDRDVESFLKLRLRVGGYDTVPVRGSRARMR